MKKTIIIVTILIAVSWIIPFTFDRVQFDRNNESSPTEATPEWTPLNETWIISLGCTMGLMIIGFGLNVKKIRLSQKNSKTKSITSSSDKGREILSENPSGITSSSFNHLNVSGNNFNLLQAALNLQVQDPPETTGDFKPIEIGSEKDPSDSKDARDPKATKKTSKNRKS